MGGRREGGEGREYLHHAKREKKGKTKTEGKKVICPVIKEEEEEDDATIKYG